VGRAITAVLVAIALTASAPPVFAGGDPESDGAPRVDRHTAEVIIDDDPRVEPELGAVALENPEYSKAVAAHRATKERLERAVETFEGAVWELGQLSSARIRLVGEWNAAERRREKAAKRLEEIRANLRELAVSQYVKGVLGAPIEGTLDIHGVTELGRRRVFVNSVQGDQLREQRFLQKVLAEQGARADAARQELDEIVHRVEQTTQIRDAAAAERDAMSVEIVKRRQDVADQRLTADVVELDFRFVNFNAYFRAAKLMRIIDPTCGIRWSAIAAIARTEGRHGTYGGSEVDANGNLTKPIYGIPLDGTNGTAALGDTDDGEFDMEPDFDRAVGPMQFIPSTWKAFARDGNNDGKADPQNMYDSALTAAVYLCRQGPGLDTDEGLRRAFFSYNRDHSYVELVLKRAHDYDAYEVPPLRPGEPSPAPAIRHDPPPQPVPSIDPPPMPAGPPPSTDPSGSTVTPPP
jgi:membrane-bound lytic murein transglycosylase B